MDVSDLDDILEIYDIPEHFKTKDVVIAFKDFRSNGFLVKWVDSNHAIGVFGTVSAAYDALADFSHSQIKLRPLNEATARSKEVAVNFERKKDSRDGDGSAASGKQPPHRYGRNDERGKRTGARGRGISRGTRGSRPERPSSSRADSEASGYSQSMQGNTRKGNVKIIDQRSSINLPDEDETNQTANPVTAKKQPFMSYHKLLELSKMEDDPDGLLLQIGNSRSGLWSMLEKELNRDKFSLIIKILSIVTRSSQVSNLRALLLEVDKKFIDRIDEILNNIAMKTESYSKFWQDQVMLQQMCICTVRLLCAFLNILRDSIGKYNGILRTIKEVQSEHNLDENDDLEKEISMCKEMIKGLKEEKDAIYREQKEIARPKSFSKTENQTPPDNFRDIDIFPKLRDIQENEKPFLRANKMEGKFDCLDTYLDIQYRLLREDYIQPLRQGISEYRRRVVKQESLKKIRDIRLYKSVQMLRPVCSSSGINYYLQFDTTDYKTMNWASSKRLLHGSLLCLSSDNFNSIIYATVTDRKAEELRDGLIQVHLEKDALQATSPGDVYVMAETTAFFEAYRHILKGLQEIDEELPFQEYFVKCQTVLKPPKYLLGIGGPSYDMKCLMEDPSNKTTIYPVLNCLRWPSERDVKFDKKQYEAVKTAITKELAIIQGPPGTGKTYVGLKITELLMNNCSLWNERNGKSPIMVVCYTNHALDQFLEGVLEFSPTGIVRVGGQCKNETLKEYTIGSIKRKKSEEKSRSFRFLQNERDCRQKLRQSEEMVTNVSLALKKTGTDIANFQVLQPFMTEFQIDSFKRRYGDENVSQCIAKWLGIEKGEVDMAINENMKLKCQWELFVIGNIKPMPESESVAVMRVWDLPLHERARLYKHWVTVICDDIEKDIERKKNEKGSLKDIHALERYSETLSNDIILAEDMIRLAPSNSMKTQINSLKRDQDQSLNKAMGTWLALDASDESNLLIKSAFDVQIPNQKEELDDVEEERELTNDDDDEVFFGHRKKNTDDDTEGENWLVQWKNSKRKHMIKNLLQKSNAITKQRASEIKSVHGTQSCRRDLYRYWLEEYRSQLRAQVKTYEDIFNEATEQLREVRDMETLDVLQDAKFIGLTTTGAAKYRSLLQKVSPRIIIVEEAAEVLESHIITALNTNCQHLILIGDHKQLRPSTTVYELAKKYNLDISLFERMVRNGIPHVTLSEQHRMRPQISELMRYKTLYPDLRDHISVENYENVKGIDGNVLFINHEMLEKVSEESTSYSNPGEAKYIASLCRYFLKQGYRDDQITVLTPYMGQVLLLRKEMPKTEFGKVRVTAVDNFQGEENEIILLSLVRSTPIEGNIRKNPIGFVGIENRICVALSRAKKGMYVIGNFNLFRLYSDMWLFMVDLMKKKGCVNDHIVVRCQNHPDKTTVIKSTEDFQKVAEGGCYLPCNTHLPCGHICPKLCHVLDKEHKHFKCWKNCTKIICERGHKCQKKCCQNCGNCNVSVIKKLPLCGHESKMPCHMDPYKQSCIVPCGSFLSCGHKCKRPCHQCKREGKHEDKCIETVKKQLACGHFSDMKCSETIDSVICKEPCSAKLQCSHLCSGNCKECYGGKIHKSCRGTCNKTLPCGHTCSYPCSDICPPCSRKCNWICSHGIKCKKLCSEECFKCEEKCAFRCEHIKCDEICHENCTDIKCNIPCLLKLRCGHHCQGICGEQCVCIKCAPDKSKKNLINEADEKEIYIVLPECKCIVEVNLLDREMNATKFSRRDLCRRCPNADCNRPIRTNIRRYTNILKQTRRDISQKYNSLNGGSQERKQKIKVLREKNLKLREIGLTTSEYLKIETQLNAENMGRLRIIEDTLDCLKELLIITTKTGDAASVFISRINDVRPDKLRKLILMERQFVTKQFWEEVYMEMKRIRMFINMHKLSYELSIRGLKSECVTNVLKIADEIFLESAVFSSMKYDAIAEVYNRLQMIANNKKMADDSLVLSMTMKLRSVKENVSTLPIYDLSGENTLGAQMNDLEI